MDSQSKDVSAIYSRRLMTLLHQLPHSIWQDTEARTVHVKHLSVLLYSMTLEVDSSNSFWYTVKFWNIVIFPVNMYNHVLSQEIGIHFSQIIILSVLHFLFFKMEVIHLGLFSSRSNISNSKYPMILCYLLFPMDA